MRKAAVSQLIELGMTRNEALAYLTLLEDEEGRGLTGYEVAARSGVPRSAVYNVLAKLEESGAAFRMGTDPVHYVPTDPDRLVDQIRRTTDARLQSLTHTLERLPKRTRPEPVWILNRYPDVMHRIETMIRGAERSVYLSLWPRELTAIQDALQDTADRDLHRVLYSPATPGAPPDGFSCWTGDIGDDDQKAGWSHRALVVVDHREALLGGTEPSADNQAVWTTNPSLVDVALNEIILDITLLARTSDRDCTEVVAPMLRPHLRTLPEGETG